MTAEIPPFWVAGVVITPDRRSAVLVMLDDGRREVSVTTVREGESVAGYRLAAVEPGHVVLERGEVQFPVAVGRPHTGPKGVPATGRTGLPPIFVPGPDKPTVDVEFARPRGRPEPRPVPSDDSAVGAAQPEAMPDLLQRLLDNPQFQQRMEERRAIMQQRMERARPDNQPQPDAPAATAKPSQRTPY